MSMAWHLCTYTVYIPLYDDNVFVGEPTVILVKDNECSALFSVGGGELMLEILPYVDFDEIENNPKWFMGYSDNTNLTLVVNSSNSSSFNSELLST